MKDLLSKIEENLTEPTARGLAQALSRAIRDGVLGPGDRLPPIRTVARELCLSPTTVNVAWAELARSNTIRTEGRRGTTVAPDLGPGASRYRHALVHQGGFALDLSNGVPDPELLPDLTAALAGVVSAASPDGYLGRQTLAELGEILRADWPYQAEAFTIVDGAMDAVELATRTKVRHGARVLLETPTFPPALDLMESLGAEVTGIPMDDDGLDPGALTEALERPATLLFMQPRGQNPTGVSPPQYRLDEIAEIVRRANLTVIEDDAAGCIAQAPAVSLGMAVPDLVVHTRSFSKSHGAELRLAAVSGTADMIGQIEGLRQFGQGWTSKILQRVLLNFLTSDEAEAQLDRARAEYSRRSKAVRDVLQHNGIEVVGGGDGVNLWVPVADESAAIMRLASQSIAAAPGTPFEAASGPDQHIRISIGLLRENEAEVAEMIAQAAQTGGWSNSRRA